jgi:predicted ArsR family transcriptional regulator
MTPKQQIIYKELCKWNETTVKELAEACGITEKATSQHLIGLLETNKIHVCGWTTTRPNHFVRIIRVGAGENITRAHGIERLRATEKRKNKAEREAVLNAPARPDIAAAWLFK